MASKIKAFDKDLRALGSTSKAFNIAKKEELMREYTLEFAVVNNDSLYSCIGENSVFQYEGQYFDINGIDGTSGASNITQVTAEHISYRLSEYTLPNGYSFVGTYKQIAEDILAEAKTVDGVSADTIFSVGDCYDDNQIHSFATSGNNVTPRKALIAMSEMGIEVVFDNFNINIVQKRGADNGVTFTYDRNLSGIRRTFQKGNGWSYEITIADLQKIPGHEGDTFMLGDYVTIRDDYAKETFKKRIISYTECDDPTQNKIVVGVFVRDSSDLAIETDSIAREADITANSAQNKANTSLQQGEKYSNVSITHTDGFKAANLSDTVRVLMNGDDCFAVQTKQNDGTWKTVTLTDEWGIGIKRFSSVEDREAFYVEVGANTDGKYGLDFYVKDKKAFRIGINKSGSLELSTNDSFQIGADDSVVVFEGNTLQINTKDIVVDDGQSLYSAYTGTYSYQMPDSSLKGEVSVVNGIIVSVSDRLSP